MPAVPSDFVPAARRRALRRALCSDALAGLKEIAKAPDNADPDSLCEIAATRADVLRVRLTLSKSVPGLLTGTTAEELEEPRCHLHDTTLQVLEYLACGGFGFCDDVVSMREVARRAGADLRHWLNARPSPPERTVLDVALRTLARDAERLGTPTVRTTVDPSVPKLSAHAMQAVSGAVRESLTNVRKHADASRVRIVATATGDKVVVLIADDGCGIAPGTAEGLGLPHSIVGRLRRAGAEGRVVSDADGTQVRIVVPVGS